jgi:hypothetical protein
MSNGGKKAIRLEPAFKALENLLDELATVDVSSLPDIGGARQQTALGWMRALDDARVGLREWCGSKGANGFMLEIPLKK